jgi:succinate dehydrogenase/fumarate reductase flavoprotein subunit
MRAAGFFGEPRDSEEKFLTDIVHQGCFLNDQPRAVQYVREGPERLIETLAWGCEPYLCDERAVFTSGVGIVDAHWREARRLSATFLDDVAILELIVEEGQVCGALGLAVRSGEIIRFDCGAVVLATGGWHKAYTPVTGSKELTGDGIAMAVRAGARAANMEFVTFACNVPLWPLAWRGSIVTYVLSLMCGGTLVNGRGEAFLDQYDPETVRIASTTEWNKSFFSFATARELRAGKATPHGGVYYTRGEVPWPEYEARALRSYPEWRFKGADFSELGRRLRDGQGIEVIGAAEYFEGGVHVDERYATGVPGLYAAGESAVSLFGANRVAAATMEMLVSGAIAGRAAAEYVRRASIPVAAEDTVAAQIAEIERPLARRGSTLVGGLRRALQEVTAAKLGPVRSAGELDTLLVELAEFRDALDADVGVSVVDRTYNKEWLEILELKNMLLVLKLSARAARARTESRGVHYREDYPDTDNDRWLREILFSLEDGEIRSEECPVRAGILELPTGTRPYLEMLRAMMDAHSDVGGHH